MTVSASSADGGAYGNIGASATTLNAMLPATDPFITVVGGTTLFDIAGKYAGEQTWNLLGLGEGVAGGGIGTVFPLLAYQAVKGVSVALANGGSATMRNIPDVAAVGDPATGIAIYNKLNGGWLVFDGASVSSPIWASFNSLVDSARVGAGLPSLGFANPLIYSLGGAAYRVQDVVDRTNGNVEVFGIPGFNAGYVYGDTNGFVSINLNAYTQSVLLGMHAPEPSQAPSST